jgi:hypothetical protein
VGEIARDGRIIVARARKEGHKNNHGNYQADKNEICLLGLKPHSRGLQKVQGEQL